MNGYTPPTKFELECQKYGLDPKLVAIAKSYGRDLILECQAMLISQDIDFALQSAIWLIDDADWIYEIESQMADHSDLLDTQASAVF